jgi:hypothetical protein
MGGEGPSRQLYCWVVLPAVADLAVHCVGGAQPTSSAVLIKVVIEEIQQHASNDATKHS